ncbi:MAG: CHAT domain-containing protein, partial [Bryobacteraceae bacterium]
LIELEVRAGLQRASRTSFRWEKGGRLLVQLQGALAADEAYLAFYLGRDTAYRWCVTRGAFRMDRIPPRAQIRAALDAFTAALRSATSHPSGAGVALYQMLFGELLREAIGKRRWLLALDADLFELALSALPVPGPRPAYLVERHAFQVVPGAWALGAAGTAGWDGLFVAIADPVYNRADPRWQETARRHPTGLRLALWPTLSARPVEEYELPRLPGSSKEAQACIAAWRGSGARTLEGAEATFLNLSRALREGPDVLHLAAHVAAIPGDPAQGCVALSLAADGRPECLGPEAIRSMRPAPPLVVLSGCRSARAQVLPGAGLLGLTRAWLAAGARSVVASLWPTQDENGELFQRFYIHLQSFRAARAAAPALALRQAQLDMLARGDWCAHPAYWAAYLVVGIL